MSVMRESMPKMHAQMHKVMDAKNGDVRGRAFVTRDPAKTKDIWRKTDDLWLSGGPGDPNVRLLRIEPITAELWDGPSSPSVAAFEFARKR